jgi:hypothetical protein
MDSIWINLGSVKTSARNEVARRSWRREGESGGSGGVVVVDEGEWKASEI